MATAGQARSTDGYDPYAMSLALPAWAVGVSGGIATAEAVTNGPVSLSERSMEDRLRRVGLVVPGRDGGQS
jgi:hypothetical protein